MMVITTSLEIVPHNSLRKDYIINGSEALTQAAHKLSTRSPESPFPQLPIEAPIRNRFGDVAFLEMLGAVQVGDGAGHAEDAVVGAGGEAEAFHGGVEKFLAGFVEDAELAELPAGHAAIEAGAVGAEAVALAGAGGLHLLRASWRWWCRR